MNGLLSEKQVIELLGVTPESFNGLRSRKMWGYVKGPGKDGRFYDPDLIANYMATLTKRSAAAKAITQILINQAKENK